MFHVQFINETAYNIEVLDRVIGTINIPASKTRTFLGHPMYPTDLNLTIEFNSGAPKTDFLIVQTSQSYGDIEKCRDNKK